jgi:hypothetical protein
MEGKVGFLVVLLFSVSETAHSVSREQELINCMSRWRIGLCTNCLHVPMQSYAAQNLEAGENRKAVRGQSTFRDSAVQYNVATFICTVDVTIRLILCPQILWYRSVHDEIPCEFICNFSNNVKHPGVAGTLTALPPLRTWTQLRAVLDLGASAVRARPSVVQNGAASLLYCVPQHGDCRSVP